MIFDATMLNRKVFYHFLNTFSEAQLLKTPKGFNNNILWNIAHTICVQQGLVYSLSGLDPLVDISFIKKFTKGSFPEKTSSREEQKYIKKMLFYTLEKTKEDYEQGVFKEFKEYTTSNNAVLKNVDDALQFNLYHEGLHMGYILSLRKFIS